MLDPEYHHEQQIKRASICQKLETELKMSQSIFSILSMAFGNMYKRIDSKN